MIKKKMLPGACIMLLWGCSDNSPDDLTQILPIAEVTYTQHVKPVIDNNCVVCHAMPPVNGAPISLTTYDQVKAAVQDHGLIHRISLDNGDGQLMPQGGPKLPQNLIDIITQWQTQGFKN